MWLFTVDTERRHLLLTQHERWGSCLCVCMKCGARGEQLLTFLHLLSVAASFAQINKMSGTSGKIISMK